jgi:hypothetical protein
MRRIKCLLLMLSTTLALSGCVASMAANAIGAAVSASRGRPVSNEGARETAISQCSALAAPYGAVHVIDVEQRSVERMVVWGTAEGPGGRQSFECAFGTKVTGFKIHPIAAARHDR